jgi:hypothetical protein
MRKRTLIGLFTALIITAIFALSWIPATQVIGSTSLTNSKVKSVVIKNAAKEASLSSEELYNNYIADLYTTAGLEASGLDLDVFNKAITGFYNLKHKNVLSSEKQILTIVDFSKSSSTKRLWIVDLSQKKLLFNTLVAHGQGSGEDLPTLFSNTTNSHQSSLGFYVTSNTYTGKHGLSLRLNGKDKNFNTNALSRAVVVHGADYVSNEFIKKHGRLGRSYGCPALPVELTPAIIETIKNGTCLFINGPEPSYTSEFLNQEVASSYLSLDSTLAVAS